MKSSADYVNELTEVEKANILIEVVENWRNQNSLQHDEKTITVGEQTEQILSKLLDH